MGGFELLSPKGDQTPLVRQYSAELASKGEFPMFCVMRVPDHERAAERIEAAGYEVGESLLEPDDDVARRSGADEARLDDFIGMKLIASQPTGARARVAA